MTERSIGKGACGTVFSGRSMHFAGAGGVGMAALAVLAKASGARVGGCDIHPGPRTRWLQAQGIEIHEGHDASHLDGVDTLVVTPAVAPDNPELVRAMNGGPGIRVVRRGEMLAAIVSSVESIAVCGSHGKTTTSTFIARLLLRLGEKVSWAIGGETGAFPVAGVADGGLGSEGSVLVVEADESDGTLALYHPGLLVVTNCEYDHPDHFKTFAEYKACFDAARRNSRTVLEAESIDIAGCEADPAFAFLSALPAHNARNAAAAAAVAEMRGHARAEIASALSAIVRELPDRRFQRIWPKPGVPAEETVGVFADYAHHPTEMKCAVAMARASCKGVLRVLFQPHRYSRTKALKDAFPAAFDGAHETVLLPTYAAFERPVEGGGTEDLYKSCRAARPGGRFSIAQSCEEGWRTAFGASKPGDVILLLGAGDVIRLAETAERDCASLEAKRRRTPQRAPRLRRDTKEKSAL